MIGKAMVIVNAFGAAAIAVPSAVTASIRGATGRWVPGRWRGSIITIDVPETNHRLPSAARVAS